MLISDEAEKTLVQSGDLEYEDHERVPFFVVTEDSVLIDTDGEGNETSRVIVDTYYTETLLSVIYAKMDSMDTNMDGSFNGSEPTSGYGIAYTLARQELWASQYPEMYTANEMIEKRRVASLTAEEYREEAREQLEAESKPSSFLFECEVKGQTLEFNIDNEDRVDVIGQLIIGQTEIEIHDKYRINSIPYTSEEATTIMIALATTMKTHKYAYDAKINALYELPDGFTKADVDLVIT